MKHQNTNPWVWVLIALAIVLFFGFFGSFGMGSYRMMDGYYGMMSGLGYGLFGWVTGLLFIAVLVLLIVWLLKQIQKK